jgi:pyruvate-formate lyase-activating enzyme
LVGVDVLPYHHTAVDKYRRLDMVYGLPELRPPSNGVMEHVAETLREYGLRVKIGS